MKKRLLAIILSLCLCITMIPLGMTTASAEVNEDGSDQLQMPAPQNVQVQLVGIKYDENNNKLLLTELSWDAIPQIDGGNSFFEIWPSLKKDENLTYPMDFDAWMGQATVIPATSANPIPGGIEYTTENGRSKLQSLVRILQPNDTQLEDNMAKGIKENDKVDVDIYTAGWDPATQTSGESEHKHVEIVYTEENVKNKKTFTEVASDDKTVAPPEEVVLKYNGQPQDCPFKDTQGYSVSLNDPQTDAGIYTAALILNSGWKCTDGTTAAKPAVWAIDKATITSVTLTSSALLYNGKEQYPTIASVNAGSLSVPAEGYSVSYSATPKLSGFYTLNVKGKGNFTGSASAEFHIDTVEMDTCTHDFPREYADNKDDATHKVFCTKCGGCLANAE